MTAVISDKDIAIKLKNVHKELLETHQNIFEYYFSDLGISPHIHHLGYDMVIPGYWQERQDNPFRRFSVSALSDAQKRTETLEKYYEIAKKYAEYRLCESYDSDVFLYSVAAAATTGWVFLTESTKIDFIAASMDIKHMSRRCFHKSIFGLAHTHTRLRESVHIKLRDAG